MDDERFETLKLGVYRKSALILDNLGLDIRLFDNFEIIHFGPSHKWWLSARLLLGMSEPQAIEAHEIMAKRGDNWPSENRAFRLMLDGR